MGTTRFWNRNRTLFGFKFRTYFSTGKINWKKIKQKQTISIDPLIENKYRTLQILKNGKLCKHISQSIQINPYDLHLCFSLGKMENAKSPAWRWHKIWTLQVELRTNRFNPRTKIKKMNFFQRISVIILCRWVALSPYLFICSYDVTISKLFAILSFKF